jgi:hypothetical protein
MCGVKGSLVATMGRLKPFWLDHQLLFGLLLDHCFVLDFKLKIKNHISVLGIRIRMFLGLPDLDLLVRGMYPDPSLFS